MVAKFSPPLFVFFKITFIYLCVGMCGDQRTLGEVSSVSVM